MYDSSETKSNDSNWIKNAKSFAFRSTALTHKLFNSSHENNLNSSQRPVILLERLGDYGMKNIIIFSYLVFLFSIILGSTERFLRKETEKYYDKLILENDSPILENDSPNSNPADIISENASPNSIPPKTWRKTIKLNPRNRFFELYGEVETPSSSETPFALNFKTTVKAFRKENNQLLHEFSTPIHYAKTSYTDMDKILFVSEINSPFGYYWQDELFQENGQVIPNILLDVEIEVLNSTWQTEKFPLSITLTFSKTRETYVTRKLILEIIFFAMTFSFFMYYALYILVLPRCNNRIVTEQKLILLLFFSILMFHLAMIFYSIPYEPSTFSLVTSRYVFIILGNVFQTTSTVLLACFILLMADVINQSSIDYSLAELLTTTKISLAVLNSVTSLTAMIISTVWEIPNNSLKKNYLVSYVYICVYSCCMVTSLILILWILNLFWSAYKELKYWNYRATRFRQLSFRFFVTQSWFILIYAFIVWSIWILTNHRVFGTPMNPLSGLGTNFLLTSFTLISAYVHLPIRDTEEEYIIYQDDFEESGFSLEVAHLMCNLSWQVYGFHYGGKAKQLDCYNINSTALAVKTCHIGNCEEFDVQWMVAEKNNIVTVAFRGTISFVNVSTNFRLYHCVVNNNFWYTGDPRFVSPSQEKMQMGCTLVHAGFMQAYLAVRREVLQAVSKVVEGKNSDAVVYLTGHSLGAALATLCCLELVCRYDFNMRLYTFGSPRVGSKSFAKLFNNLVPKNKSFRLVFESDIVATYPTRLASYEHINSEVYMDRGGNLLFSPNMVEGSLLPGKNRIDHHALSLYLGALQTACAQYGIPLGEKVEAFKCNKRKMEFNDGI